MEHELLNAPLCILLEGVKADVYTWIWIHQGGIIELSPLVDVAQAWVLRFNKSFQFSLTVVFPELSNHLVGWGEEVQLGPRAISNLIWPQNHEISRDCINPLPTMKASFLLS